MLRIVQSFVIRLKKLTSLICSPRQFKIKKKNLSKYEVKNRFLMTLEM